MHIELKNIEYVYFIGVGGIGMSALARYFNQQGLKVSGYDKTATNLITQLIDEGIPVHFVDDLQLIECEVLNPENKDKVLVVYTPAVPKTHSELCYFQNNGYTVMKRAEVLGLISEHKKCIGIAGTHGKTTVTTTVTHLLNASGQETDAFLGGISKNFESNLVSHKTADWVCVEADEFDRSFLSLSPNIAVITAIDADHLDIYGDKSAIVDAFAAYTSQIQEGGSLIIKKGVDFSIDHLKNVKIYTYSVSEPADFCIKNLNIKNGEYHFDFVTPLGELKNMCMTYPGLVNVENAIAALAVAILRETDSVKLKEALKSFDGVVRRFDVQFKNEQITYIDDYAHHPEELKAVISSVKQLYPNKRITGIFQPHLFTRTRDFADEFARSLELLDELILLEIYPARELPIEGVNSQMLLDKIELEQKYICDHCELLKFVKSEKHEVILTLGAGDIDKLVSPIRETLKAKYEA